jgi:hypothetical protein
MRISSVSDFLQGRLVAESNDAYPCIIKLNARWRVIVCRDGVQWIIQYRNRRSGAETLSSSDWRGRSYCTTKTALIRVCEAHCGEIEPAAAAVLAALPMHFDPAVPLVTVTAAETTDPAVRARAFASTNEKREAAMT